MPLFGPASGQGAKITDWGDVDALDVDALAEYFLEEANTANTGVGMTFDFRYASVFGLVGIVADVLCTALITVPNKLPRLFRRKIAKMETCPLLETPTPRIRRMWNKLQ